MEGEGLLRVRVGLISYHNYDYDKEASGIVLVLFRAAVLQVGLGFGF